ncbi:unnamed protein product [Absidia cylindrospora]
MCVGYHQQQQPQQQKQWKQRQVPPAYPLLCLHQIVAPPPPISESTKKLDIKNRVHTQHESMVYNSQLSVLPISLHSPIIDYSIIFIFINIFVSIPLYLF